MRYDLVAIAKRARNIRRKSAKIRDIAPPSMFAGDLYRACYQPIIALWSSSLQRILSEYSKTIGQTVDEVANIEGAIQNTERQFTALSFTLTPALERLVLRVERWHRTKWRGAVLSATGVDIGQIIGPQDVRQTLEATINYNVSLIRDVSAQAQSRITAIIYDGLRNNKPTREVAKELRGVVEMGRSRSILIASDQLSKLTSSLADERRRQAGLNVWEWKHSGKLSPRLNHKARDGNYYSDNPKDVGKVINGNTVLPLPSERPGQLIRCGCRSQSVIVF